MITLRNVLDKLDNELVDRLSIYEQLRKVTEESIVGNQEIEAEKIAFIAHYKQLIEDSNFDLYDDDYNEILNHKNLSFLLSYWSKRRLEAKNPLMKFTYTKLLWEFRDSLDEKSIIPSIIEDLAVSSIELSQTGKERINLHDIMVSLSNALSVSIKAKRNDLIEKIKAEIMSYCGRKNLISGKAVWYPIFFVLLRHKKEVKLTEIEKSKILDFITDLLLVEPYPPEIVRITEYLCKYRGEKVDKELALKACLGRLEQFGASGITLSMLYKNLLDIAKQYGLNDYVKKITSIINKLGASVISQMAPMSPMNSGFEKKSEADWKEWKNLYSKNLAIQLKKHPFNDILLQMTVDYIPVKSDIENEMKRNSSLVDIPGIVTQMIVNKQGVPVTQFKGNEKDETRLIYWLYTKSLPENDKFFMYSFYELFSQYKEACSDILEMIESTEYITERHKKVIKRGVEAFFQEDFIVSITLFIPQIEDIIRTVIQIHSGDKGVTLKAKDYGFDEKSFDELLNSPESKQLFDESTLIYLKAMLSNRYGYNLRNVVCHGLLDVFSNTLAYRTLHIVIILISMFQVNDINNDNV